jgi:predicted transcriptional regulator of viral defense system
MKNDIPAGVKELAGWQAGAISRRQLLDAGLTAKMIDGRLNRGHWQVLHRGVYAVFSGPPSRETQLWAAVLRAGDGAVLSHQSAAELHGLIDSPAGAIYLTVPASRRVTSPGLVIRISGRIDQAT